MRFPLFVDAVSRHAGLPAAQAATIARAVLQTMVERMSGGTAGHLPDELDGYLAGPGADGPATAFGPADFVRRVGERAGVDEATARTGTGAVFATLREAVTVDEFHDMVARLPRDFDGMTQPIPRPDDV
ncbi:DUF2267 domain-containing protein [Micromonospora peucetia]|uniref:DUF2267 domain-containing protein n=1 Tax=Micromonospora peucetia TaxID=47871 RepID=A0A1C6W4X5_9ACTN|nr:DUF2267 domain-containing protein [Micromonospora peucetia]MCX4390297.1 DUF2267 domain-containing protein [Micromonospora peucetia]WSA32398.1 DUF2267 domain-containing protein [Micromonospora peucetia]SCL73260.1 Uncharacterized conserved protein, DUF2267 family [Micromonospora peucetia]